MSDLDRDGPVVYFDGDCALCHWAVRTTARYDRAGMFRFAPLDGDTARTRLTGTALLRTQGTVVVADEGRLFTRSAAVLHVVRRLRWPARALALLWIVPAPLRDAVYDVIARHRSRWFGRADRCDVAGPALRGRLLP